MTITSSGAKCDVCGKYILPLPGELMHTFSIKGIIQKLHCDNDCKKLLEEIKGDWKKLPEGPLRKAFEPKGMCINRTSEFPTNGEVNEND